MKANRIHRLSIDLFLLILLALNSKTLAQQLSSNLNFIDNNKTQTCTIRLSTDKNSYLKNELFYIDIIIGNVDNLLGFAADFNFDTLMVDYVGSEEGTFMNEDGKVSTSFMKSIDNEKGKIILGLSRLNHTGRSVSTEVTIVRILVRAKAIGVPSFSVSNIGFVAPNGSTKYNYTPPSALSLQIIGLTKMASVSMQLLNYSASYNTRFSVGFSVQNLENVNSIAVDFVFNQDSLEFLGGEEGVLFSSNGTIPTSFMAEKISSSGRVTVGLSRLGSEHGVSDSTRSNAFTLRFHPKVTGVVGLRLTNVGLILPNGITRQPVAVDSVRSFSIVYVSQNTGIIAGTVKDDSSMYPLDKTTIIVSPGSYSATSISNGKYYIFDVPVGTNYLVTASKSGYESKSRSPVNVILDSMVEINLLLKSIVPKVGAIICVVTDSSTKQPLNDVSVFITPRNYSGTTRANGICAINNVAAGTGYIVTARKNGYNSCTKSSIAVFSNETTSVNLELSVIRQNTAPIARFTVTPSSGQTSTAFSFDASGSFDSQDAIFVLQVRWDWDNDGTWDYPTSGYTNAKTVTHQFGTAGTHTVKLEVKDTGGLTGSITKKVSALEQTRVKVQSDSLNIYFPFYSTTISLKFDGVQNILGKEIIITAYGNSVPEDFNPAAAFNSAVGYYALESNQFYDVKARLQFFYTDSLLNALGMPEKNLELAFWDDSTQTWKALPTTIDEINNIASTTIKHFSLWALTDKTETLINSIKETELNVSGGSYALSQNYPNPFNPITTIIFQSPRSGNVSLKIFNILGQEVKTLIDNKLTEGSHEVQWDGTNNLGNKVASGIYIYRMETNTGYVNTMKMVLLK